MDYLVSEAATGGLLLKKLSLKISQISQENTCVGVSLHVNIAKLLRTPILKNICERLLLTFFKKAAWLKPPQSDYESTQSMSRSLIDAIYILSLTNIVHYTKFSPKRQQVPNHRSCRSRMFFKIGVLKDKHLCWSLFLIKLQFFKKETPTQVISCKYCKIFRNSFFYRTPPVAAP